MTRRDAFLSEHPDAYFLDAHDLPELAAHLGQLGWLDAGEEIRSAEKPGDGNMNCTLRVTTSRRSVILKQARPWVERYDHIPAPWNRALVEGKFYELAAAYPEVRDRMPRFMGLDVPSRMLMLEDVGRGADFTGVYRGDVLRTGDVDELAAFLSALHRIAVPADATEIFANREMRDLNHQYIFHVPLQPDNGLDLDGITDGLTEAARALQADATYVAAVAELGQEYLRNEGALAHGDFFPGSWLRTADGPRVIDPEFCFIGPPEFDVGVMIAHLEMGSQPRALARRLLDGYRAAPPPGWSRTRQARVLQFAGVELMRRLIGIAQVPVTDGIDRKREWLDLSRGWVLDPQASPLVR